MTTTIKFVAIVLFTITASIVALPARASAPGLTVRIVDTSAVERSIGACDSGYMLRDESSSGSRPIAFHGGEATLSMSIGSPMVAPAFYCAGRHIGFPSNGVAVEMR